MYHRTASNIAHKIKLLAFSTNTVCLQIEKKTIMFLFSCKEFFTSYSGKILWMKDFRKNAKEGTLIFLYKKMVLNSV
jgi:hypothetical protein